MLPCEYIIHAELWLWNFEKGSWHFITLPKEIADEIYFGQKLKNIGMKRGFGSIKVLAKIGESEFSTSIFPSSKDKTYVMPIKAAIRKTENLKNGDIVKVEIKIKDI